MEVLKKQVRDSMGDKVEEDLKKLGYIEPGHGLRGKQRWLNEDSDLTELYTLYHTVNRKEILLWCFAPKPFPESNQQDLRVPGPSKRQQSNGKDLGPMQKKSKDYENVLTKAAEVELISSKLEEKHEHGKYTPEQYNAWAHLIHMKKHSSYENPPNKRFFGGHSKKEADSEMDVGVSKGMSPGKKKIELRGQCIEQMLKWHELLDKGGISQDQYHKLQTSIMDDIGNL